VRHAILITRSTRSWSLVPRHPDHPFHGSWSPIPRHRDHRRGGARRRSTIVRVVTDRSRVVRTTPTPSSCSTISSSASCSARAWPILRRPR